MRASIVGAVFAVGAGLVIWVVMAFVGANYPVVDYTAGHQSGQPVHVTLQTVPSLGEHFQQQTWVSYLVRDPAGHWVHTTLFRVPAHTKVDVTIYNYDSGSPLRNQEIGQVYGVDQNRIHLSGPKLKSGYVSLINSYNNNGVGHTFSVPALGINVPLEGIDPNATNTCSNAPCSTSFAHNTITFSFTTPSPGKYRFQCFVPCGLGWLDGNGGPMGTLGYMGGFIEVTA